MANNFQFTANNSQFTGMQPAQSHVIMGPPCPLPPMSMQFYHGVPLPPPPPPPFIPPPVQFHRPQQYSQATLSLAPLPPLQRPLLGYGFPQGVPLQLPQFLPTFGGHIPPSYTPLSQVGQEQSNVGSTTQHQPISQANIPNFSAGGQPWFPTGIQNMQPVMPPQVTGHGTGVQPWLSKGNQIINPVFPLQHIQETNSGTQQLVPSQNQNEKSSQSEPVEKASSDWKEHTSSDGKKYYHNKKTGVSSWGKPLELMTLTERADATTGWREVTTPEGLKFFYNKVSKISTWALPVEVKLAREQANLRLKEVTVTVKDINSNHLAAVSISGIQASTPDPISLSLPVQLVSTPVSETQAIIPEPAIISASLIIQEEVANLGMHNTPETTTPRVASDTPMDITTASVATPTKISVGALTQEGAFPSSNSINNVEKEGNETARISESGGTTSTLEGKKVEHGPLVYENKEEAKKAFKALLESVNVGSGWIWDQAMRLIANDRRYAALKTLGERKQAFNEFVGQKKKQEAEERRIRQKKAREGYKTMLEECKDLTSTTRWSKAVNMFKDDERFQAVERAIDREDFFDDYIEEMKKMERAKVLEERKRFTTEYLEFLKSCDFINSSSQWRKVQHRLGNDERCSRLDKIERLEIFQEYVQDLEKEEEEQRKLRLEEQRKAERKNRYEFRKLIIEHIANGMINARTQWRDYCTKLKDAPAYMAVSANTSGSTPKDLFEDVTEDLEKQYVEDRERIEDTIKIEKISLSTDWTIEDFKAAISKEISSKPISDINLMLVYDALMEKAKGRAEKEAKKRKRLAEDVHEFLFTSKAKKESERKERKEKEKKEKEIKNKNRKSESRKATKERRRREDTDSDVSESSLEENNLGSRDRIRKHRKRQMDSLDDENDHSRSRRRSVDSK